jgi:hypothetical protein
LPAWGVFIPLCIAICINQYVFSMATYLRSFMVEPFLIQSVLTALITAGGSFLLRHQSPTILAGWFCTVTICMGLGFGQWIFHRWRHLNMDPA